MLSPDQVTQSNTRLSEDYLKFVSSTSADPSVFGPTARAIRTAPVDIRAHFTEHGDLSGLVIPGVGPKTKTALVPILMHGIDAVLKMNSTPVDRPLDKTVFQAQAKAAVQKHRDEIREGE